MMLSYGEWRILECPECKKTSYYKIDEAYVICDNCGYKICLTVYNPHWVKYIASPKEITL